MNWHPPYILYGTDIKLYFTDNIMIGIQMYECSSHVWDWEII